MTPSDRRAYILAATCEGCRASLDQKYHKFPHQYIHGVDDYRHVACTANHALADEVEEWIAEAEESRGIFPTRGMAHCDDL